MMELATIEMPRVEARKAYLEYRDAIKETHQAELDEVQARQLAQDQAIASGYRQLSIGRQLIRLSTSVAAGGLDKVGRPRLAIARCDFEEVEMTRQRSGEIIYREWKPNWWNRNEDMSYSTSKVIRLQLAAPDDQTTRTAIATVPPVPPAFRPGAHPRNYHILFDATWRNPSRRRTSRAPRDPALLRQLGGDLYAVLAVWDLTEVERAALDAGTVA